MSTSKLVRLLRALRDELLDASPLLAGKTRRAAAEATKKLDRLAIDALAGATASVISDELARVLLELNAAGVFLTLAGPPAAAEGTCSP
jgi:hypothetical protein